MSYTDLSFTFRMGVSTVSSIIGETMTILWDILYPIHMPVPEYQQFVKIAEQFYKRWNFPNCLGAIDGRHVRIKRPSHSGSLYFNYKKFFSIVLQAVVDANYRYITIDVGGFGHQSDGGTFKSSTLYTSLKDNLLQIPQVSKLPGSEIELPYFLVGDGAYPLMEHLMKPYAGLGLPAEKENFIRRLSRARMVVECAFGITCQKWRIFYTTIQQPPEVPNVLVKCTCILHNVIIDLENDSSTHNSFVSTVGNPLVPLSPLDDEAENNFVVGYGKEDDDFHRTSGSLTSSVA